MGRAEPVQPGRSARRLGLPEVVGGFVRRASESTEAPAATLPSLTFSAPAPNPSSGLVRTTLTLTRPAHIVVPVLDVLGRTVAVAFDGFAAGTVEIALEASRLAPVVYALRAATADSAATVRVVVR